MSDFVQEPAETYGEQIKVENRLQYPFIRFPVYALDLTQALGKDAILVYLALLRFADGRGVCWPSVHTLEKLTTLGRNRLFKALRVLTKANLLERHQMRKGKEFGANSYTLLPVEEWQPELIMVAPSMASPKPVRVPESGTPKQVHKLDPIELDPEENTQERAREEIFDMEEAEEELCAACNEPIGLGHVVGCVYQDEDTPPQVPPSPPPRVHDSVVIGQKNAACDAFHDPTFPCAHIDTALHGLTELFGRVVTYKQLSLTAKDSLRLFVHEHGMVNTLKLAEHFCQHERDRTKWTVGLIFAPEQAAARFAALQHLPPLASANPERPEDRVIRPGANKVFPPAERDTSPADPATEAEAKAAIANVHKMLNERKMD